MTPALSLYNLTVWIAQVFVITSIGAVLPLALRIHHPRSNLVYYRLLLLAALLLPLLQPIQHEVVVVRDGDAASTASTASMASSASSALPATAASPAATSWNWRDVILIVLSAGVIVRIGWLTGGLWQLRRLRNSSRTLYPFPPAVQNALAATKADALFCVSPTVKGPVTFGFLRPVVLLPEAFLQMPEEAQHNVACHELVHVRRHDWLLTIVDELLASLLWFQPAVWWLIARNQLAREQLVDAEVVSLTASRETYIKTLFSLAGARWEADLGVASLFLRKRHLIHRVHSLLTEVSMSKKRLLSSYCSIAAILGIGGALMSAALPLSGEPEIRRVAAAVQPRPAQNSPGYVVNRSPISYPAEALQKRIEGTVVVELTFNARGEIVDARVLSGPEELRQAGLQTAVQGKYGIDIARTLQVVVDFKLPAPGQRGPGQRGQGQRSQAPIGSSESGLFTELSGTVADSSGNPIPGVTITAKNADRSAFVRTNASGEYRFPSVPPGTYSVSAELLGFQTGTFDKVPLGRSQQVRLNFSLQIGTATSQPQAVTSAPGKVRVGGRVVANNLITRVPPVYPEEARRAQAQGAVVLEANINKEGRVESLNVVSGHPLLIQAALDAVRQWVYRPVLLNGQPVDVVTSIELNLP